MLRKCSNIFVGALLTTGLLFKFMHWPYAGELLYSSLIGIVLLLLDYAIQNRGPKLLSRNLIFTLLGVIYVTGVAFKIWHLPGAGTMLIVSLIGLSIGLAEFAFCLRKSLNALLPALFSITLFFILFRILHWPEPSYVLYGSYFSFALLVPILMFLKGFKLKSSNASLSNHFLLIGSLSLVLFVVEVLVKATAMGKIDCCIELNYLWLIDAYLFCSLVLAISKTLKLQELKQNFLDDYRLLNCLKGIYLILLVLFALISAN